MMDVVVNVIYGVREMILTVLREKKLRTVMKLYRSSARSVIRTVVPASAVPADP